jgi:hypothetical protein
MSIASEITALNTNLSAAKTAVTTKGGTVGDTGLAGLADEIATIPTGGSLENYGTITYLDGNNVEQTLTLANEDDFIELCIGDANTVLNINNTSVVKNKITSVTVADGVQYLPNNFCRECGSLTSVNLPSSIHYMGDYVFNSCITLNAPLTLTNVKYIGDYFLISANTYNQPISLPNIDVIGAYFLNSCSAFNSSITLNDNMKSIGQRFMESCSNFAQPLSIPSGLEIPIGSRFMYNCNSFTGPLACNSSLTPTATGSALNQILSTTNNSASMYTTGITLTGTYASDLKTTLPDRDSSPYRKLIIGS